jgi:hypothetical protein
MLRSLFPMTSACSSRLLVFILAFGLNSCGASRVAQVFPDPGPLPPPGGLGSGDLTLQEKASLAGQHGGRAWKFAAGNAQKSSSGDMMLTFFDAKQESPCGTVGFSASRTLLTSIPAKTGTYRNADVPQDGAVVRTLTFTESFREVTKASSNAATDRFLARIDSIIDKEIKGTLTAQFDDKNSVSGTFTIVNCLKDAQPFPPTPEPTPVVTATPTPSPSPTPTPSQGNPLPAELNGTWEESVTVVGDITQLTRLTLSGGRKGSQTIFVGVAKIIDFEFDASVPTDSPELGMDMRVTRVNYDPDNLIKVGDVALCIRRLDASTPQERQIFCGLNAPTLKPKLVRLFLAAKQTSFAESRVLLNTDGCVFQRFPARE